MSLPQPVPSHRIGHYTQGLIEKLKITLQSTATCKQVSWKILSYKWLMENSILYAFYIRSIGL